MKNFVFSILLIFSISLSTFCQPAHSFKISGGNFLLDGKPFQLHSGEMHYARIPRAYWHQRLEMLRAMGMNTVATYVFWNYHETAPGVWDFKSGNRDIMEFIRIAQEVGLLVILRPGPYACAEWDYGGLPWWLQKNPDLQIRTDNTAYLDSCKVYINQLAKQIRELQITNGGPVIMVQVENEYGSFVEQRHIPLMNAQNYTYAIKQDLIEAGINVPLFTADGSSLFKDGHVNGTLPAANGEEDINVLKKAVNDFHHGTGPYMIAEFYPGWLDHWGEPFQQVGTDKIITQLDQYLEAGVSFNFYMAHGGTNFGFTSGANYDKQHPIQPDITSYDYDAPITEAGWPTAKYFAIRNEMEKYLEDSLPRVPEKNPLISIPPIHLNRTVDLFDVIKKMKPVINDSPMSFKDFNQGEGYILYRRKFNQPVQGTLSVPGLRDYALVYINGNPVFTLNRMSRLFSCLVHIPAGGVLDILVENMGRINYGAEMADNLKGIIKPVTIDGKVIRDSWEMYGFSFEPPQDISDIPVTKGNKFR